MELNDWKKCLYIFVSMLYTYLYAIIWKSNAELISFHFK